MPRARQSARGGIFLLAAAAVAFLGAVSLSGSDGRHGLAQARVQEVDLAPADEGAAPAPGSCAAASSEGMATFEEETRSWDAAVTKGRLLSSFGKRADAAERQALVAFDRECGEASVCADERAWFLERLRRGVWTSFLKQRQLLEQDVTDTLIDDLLDGMERRGDPLRVQEKVHLLRQAVNSYKKQVKWLLPSWAETSGDPEAAQAERRLGQVEFAIEESPNGQAVKSLLKMKRNQRLLNKRAHGISVSLDPTMRFLVRPDGLGNLQVFGNGPAGPPGAQADVNVGIINDGSMAEVYREHPEPPRVTVQPGVKVNLNMR